MEESNTLQKYYSCFLLPRPRREHHLAEDTETSGGRMLHIHKCQNRVTTALSEQGDERPLEKWSCVSKKVIESVTGGWILLLSLGDRGVPAERKCGDVSSGTWRVPIGLEAVQACRSVWECGRAIREFTTEFCVCEQHTQHCLHILLLRRKGVSPASNFQVPPLW